MRIGGHLFQVETRAVLSRADADSLAASVNARPSELPDLIARLLRLGPELLSEVLTEQFPDARRRGGLLARGLGGAAPRRALRAAGRARHLRDRARVGGELLRPIVEANGDVRMHISNGAATSFADTLPLLHPHGVLQCHDLFVTDIHQYLDGFRGPGKYDGSVVNWVNGRLLAAIGSRRGFDVTFRPVRPSRRAPTC